jgi:hypothetical protein
MSARPAARPDLRFPWEPESAQRAQLAMAGLRQLVSQRAGRSGASLIVAAGALVGFAAQNAALEQGELLTRRRDLVAPESVMLRRAEGGARYLLGRWINAPLLLGYGHAFPLQRFVVQAAAGSGAKRAQFPDFWELERRVAQAAGEADFGRLEPGADRGPVPRPQAALRALWPQARRILAAPMPLEYPDEPALHEAHWTTILSLTAAKLLGAAGQAVAPVTGAGLMMEAAMIASKLDPDLVEPGRWRLAPGPRGLQIARDDRLRKSA